MAYGREHELQPKDIPPPHTDNDSRTINRAFDQVLMDVALHRAGVTFVLDRAGVTGPDGPSHHGMWDLSILQVVPHIRLAAPRDAEQALVLLALREALDEGLDGLGLVSCGLERTVQIEERGRHRGHDVRRSRPARRQEL